MKKKIIILQIILCSIISSQDCDAGEVSLWPNYVWGGCFNIEETTIIDFSNVYAPINDILPPEIGQLINLERLDLSNGSLNISGPIPPEIGNLINLTYLNLSNNHFSGSIPSEIGQLANLEELYITRHWLADGLTGSIPSEVGDLDNLTWLDLSDNQLSGTIPPEIGDMNSLKWLELMNNNLSGTIPPEIANNNTLLWMYLDQNELVSPIPSEIGNFSSLKRLSLSENQFTGSIPAFLGNISTLERLYLNGNEFSGEIPSEFNQLTTLGILNLSNNQLMGGINSLLNLIDSDFSTPSLGTLELSDNQLSGDIPYGLSGLTILNLANNSFTGSLPEDIFQVYNTVNLANNQFSGELTEEMFDHLDCNTIEENCIYCGGIDELYINGNQLSGELPDNLCNLRCVTFLDMSDNQFCGPYPVCDYLVYWGGYNLIDETQQDISNCPTCSSEYTEIDGACYNNDDLIFLQSLIDNSQNTSSSSDFNENPPNANMEPINLGNQVWQDLEDDIWPTNRLVEFCSSNNESNGTCYSEYILSGDVPSLAELDGLLHLDLRNNKLSDLESFNETSNLEYLYLSNNLFDNFPGSIYNMSNLMELWISDNNLNTIDETNEICDFFSSLSSYTLDGNYICSGNAPSCITISNQNTINCCAESLGSEYIDYLGECYFESDLDVINNISQSIFNVSAIWSDYRVVELNLSNNQLSEIPESIWQLEQLQALYLNNNALTEFSFDSLSNFNNLTILDLSSNQITYLSEDNCNLYNNLDLNMTYNPICESENLLSCLSDDVCFVPGCTDSLGCNYNQYATDDDGSCVYAEENYSCDGNCTATIDECGVCGGSGIVPPACDCEGTSPDDGYDCDGNFLSIDNTAPIKFELLDIYPNPFNPITTIALAVDSYSAITMNILNLNGVLVEQIANENLSPGIYNFQWKPENISNGVYFITVNNGNENIIQKITFIK